MLIWYVSVCIGIGIDISDGTIPKFLPMPILAVADSSNPMPIPADDDSFLFKTFTAPDFYGFKDLIFMFFRII